MSPFALMSSTALIMVTATGRETATERATRYRTARSHTCVVWVVSQHTWKHARATTDHWHEGCLLVGHVLTVAAHHAMG